jgi:hypothetical protein
VICPQCTNEVSVTEAQYLSMYTCGKCQAVYFIDITGQPEFGDMSVPIPVEENAPELENNFTSEISAEISNDLAAANFSMDLNSDVNPFDAPSPEAADSSVFGAVASEITDFANQDNSISALSYDLKVTGLDTKDAMMLFKEAVEDSKFGWIAQDIFSTIKNGECEFKNLNPVQAFILAKRIQFLDIEMQWAQNVQV